MRMRVVALVASFCWLAETVSIFQVDRADMYQPSTALLFALVAIVASQVSDVQQKKDGEQK